MREAGRASGGVRGLEKGRKRFLGREKALSGAGEACARRDEPQ